MFQENGNPITVRISICLNIILKLYIFCKKEILIMTIANLVSRLTVSKSFVQKFA